MPPIIAGIALRLLNKNLKNIEILAKTLLKLTQFFINKLTQKQPSNVDQIGLELQAGKNLRDWANS